MADETLGLKLQLDANDGIKSLKELKNQIKEAKGDVIEMSQKFGETSEQARMAAKRVAELEDAIGDSKTLIDQFNPDKKFNAFAQSLNGVLGGFTALQGAMGLLGVESEDLQKQLLKVQSALALSQGLNQVMESGNAIQNFGKTIINTFGKGGAIGVAIAGVTALGYAIFKATEEESVFEKVTKLTAEAHKKAQGIYVDQVSTLEILISKVKSGTITQNEKTAAVKNYNDKLGDTLGKVKNYAELENNLIKNGGKYIEYLKAKAEAEALGLILVEATKKKIETENMNATEFASWWEKISVAMSRGSIANTAAVERRTEAVDKQIAIIDKMSTAQQKANAVAEQLKKELNIKTETTGKTPVDNKKDEVKQLSEYEKVLRKAELDENARQLQEQRDKHMRSRELITDQNAFVVKSTVDLHSVTNELDQAKTRNEAATTDARTKLSEKERDVKLQHMMELGNAFNTLSDLFGQQTAAGKVMGIASAVINTYVGANKALAQGGFAGIAMAVSVIASGLANVKKIISVKVPGKTQAPVPSISNTAPSAYAPLSPSVTSTQLNQQQLNQLGNATTRAYVVESDVSGNQERIRRLNRAARLG